MFKPKLAKHRVLPDMPTVAQADADRDLAVTDQAAMLYTVNITDGPTLNILSITALTRYSANGLYPTHQDSSRGHGERKGDEEGESNMVWETEEGSNARYDAMIERLRAICHNRDTEKAIPNIILFHDVDQKRLQLRFNLDQWSIGYAGTTAIAYQNNLFTQIPTFTSPEVSPQGLSGQVQTASGKDTSIVLYNIDQPHTLYPTELQEQYRALLSDTVGDIAIIAGQFGASVAPTPSHEDPYDNPRNIATGLMPLADENQAIQMPRFTQGCFVHQDGKTQQAERAHVSLQGDRQLLGQFIDPDADMTKREDPYQPILLLDYHYSDQTKNAERLDFVPTIPHRVMWLDEYQEKMRDILEEPELEVLFGINSMNSVAVGIKFSGNTHLHVGIHRKLAHLEGVKLQEIDGHPCLFVPKLLSRQLYQAINDSIPKLAVIAWIDKRIEQLGKAKGILLEKGDTKIAELNALKETIDKGNIGNMDFTTIKIMINQWEVQFSAAEGYTEKTRTDIMNKQRSRLPQVNWHQSDTTDNDDKDINTVTATGEQLRKLLREIDHSDRGLAVSSLYPLTQHSLWSRLNPFMRSGRNKEAAICELVSTMMTLNTEVTANELNQMITTWKSKTTHGGNGENLSNEAVLGWHRLRFQLQEQPQTHSLETVNKLQAELERKICTAS